MWPRSVPWQDLAFGVELEFVGGRLDDLTLLPGWHLQEDELQVDDDGRESGGEAVPPPLHWDDRRQIREMLSRLQDIGARANWSCGLHVHVGLEPWGPEIVPHLVDAALDCQKALSTLLATPEHRERFCPPLSCAMREAWRQAPGADPLRHRGRPQSHRCGVNVAAWYDTRTVEIRYGNGTLRYAEVLHTIELCLRLVAAVGRGVSLDAGSPEALADRLGAPRQGYAPARPAPEWYRERLWWETALLPALAPLALVEVPGEVLEIRPATDGVIVVVVEEPNGETHRLPFQWQEGDWRPV